jgi:hypothetical protein
MLFMEMFQKPNCLDDPSQNNAASVTHTLLVLLSEARICVDLNEFMSVLNFGDQVIDELHSEWKMLVFIGFLIFIEAMQMLF